jgi:hypothetical protein
MVVVHIEITVSLDRKVDKGMFLEKLEHMIEKADARIDDTFPGSVEIET